MPDLVVIVPSRGRPERAQALAQAFKATCTADTLLLFAVDYTDPARDVYGYLPLDSGAICRPAHTTTMVEALNGAALALDDRHFAIGFMGDDHMPRTVGWDEQYLTALREMGTGIVYGNDLLQGHRLPTQVAMTSDIVRAVGYMAPPTLRHLYVDNTWLVWGNSLGRLRYLNDVIVEHRHPIAGKAVWDDNYARVNSSEVAAHDEAAFEAYKRDQLDADLAKIRAVMAVPA